MSRAKKICSTLRHWLIGNYVRLSKEDLKKKKKNDDSNSIINQEKIINDYIKFELNDEEYEVVDVYKDDGVSGTTIEDRKDFQRLLKDIDDGKVNCVIVKDLSRFARNFSESDQLLTQKFVQKEIRFIAVLDNIDTYKDPEATNRLDYKFKQLMNEQFCQETSNKVIGTLKSKKRDGYYVGPAAPYGYLKDPDQPGHLIVDDEAAKVVKDIFTWFIGGISKNQIVRMLNERNVPNPTIYKHLHNINFNNSHGDGLLWCPKTISYILKNETYIGSVVQGREQMKNYKVHERVGLPKEKWYIIPNKHEPIIEKREFDRAQELLTLNIKSTHSKHETPLFSGLMYCSDCGLAMSRSIVKGKYCYYICRTYKDMSKSACTKHSIREDWLKEAVLKSINLQLVMIEELRSIVESISSPVTFEQEVQKVEILVELKMKTINQCTNISSQAYLDWKCELITAEMYRKICELQQNTLAQAKEELKKQKDRLDELRENNGIISNFFEYFKAFQQIDKLERGILLAMIERIEVKEDKTIVIKYRFQDQFKLISSAYESQYADEIIKVKKFSF